MDPLYSLSVVLTEKHSTDGCPSVRTWHTGSTSGLVSYRCFFVWSSTLLSDAFNMSNQRLHFFSFFSSYKSLIRYFTPHNKMPAATRGIRTTDFSSWSPQCSVCKMWDLLDINTGLLAASDSRVLFFKAGDAGSCLICMGSLITALLL